MERGGRALGVDRGRRVVDPVELEAQRKREAAFDRARTFFQANADGLAYLVGGRVEDHDSLHMEAGQELRELTTDLMDANLSTSDVVRNVRAGLNQGIDSYSSTIRAFERLLTDDREALIQERINAEAAMRATLAKNPQA